MILTKKNKIKKNKNPKKILPSFTPKTEPPWYFMEAKCQLGNRLGYKKKQNTKKNNTKKKKNIPPYIPQAEPPWYFRETKCHWGNRQGIEKIKILLLFRLYFHGSVVSISVYFLFYLQNILSICLDIRLINFKKVHHTYSIM